jgi:hypothetical protein
MKETKSLYTKDHKYYNVFCTYKLYTHHEFYIVDELNLIDINLNTFVV